MIEKDLEDCKKIIQICDDLLHSEFKMDNESIELSQCFAEYKADLADQLKKFEKEIYEIAIVGREGKTLVKVVY